jgi:hypothetical protein
VVEELVVVREDVRVEELAVVGEEAAPEVGEEAAPRGVERAHRRGEDGCAVGVGAGSIELGERPPGWERGCRGGDECVLRGPHANTSQACWKQSTPSVSSNTG